MDFKTCLRQEFRNEQSFKYLKPFQKSDSYEALNNNIIRQINDFDGVFSVWTQELFIFHFEYAIYTFYEQKDEALAKKHLVLAVDYGFFCLEYGSQSCGCFQPAPFVIINKAVFMMSLLLITDDESRFHQIGTHLINSLNGKNCIIKTGYAEATISWFLLELFSAYSEQEITLHKLLRPKSAYPYEEIAKNWDTQDEAEVEKYIHLLCDAHSAQADIDYDIHLTEEFDSLKYRELFMVSMYFIPFEVIVWLKLRAMKNLENPTEFSHPLMNTPLAQFFLNLETPLPKPEELPYAKELLIKLKEKCPDIEIPSEFLN